MTAAGMKYETSLAKLPFVSRLRAWLGALLLVVSVAPSLAGAADAADPHAMLRKGIALQREASWAASISTLEKARASGVLSSAERIECAFYLGAAYVAIGSDSAARRELAAVLEAQPSFEPPPYTSPKVASLLGEVSRERAQAPGLDARPPRPTEDGVFELGFDARRARAPIYGVVRFRMRGTKRFAEAPLAVTGEGRGGVTVAARVPAPEPGVLEYYADALSSDGALRAGSDAQPLELPVPAGVRLTKPAPHRTSRLQLVWLAIPVGAIVGAGLGLGLYFGLRAR